MCSFFLPDELMDSKKFVKTTTLYVDPDDWATISHGKILQPNYLEYFASLLHLQGIPCVVKSNGYYQNKKNDFVIRLFCSLDGCARKYNLCQIPYTCEFILKRNCVPIRHQYQSTRAIRVPSMRFMNKRLWKKWRCQIAVMSSTLNCYMEI